MNLPLILNFTKQDLIDRYSGSVLGGLWSFILPLVNILIFILIFSKIMGAKLAVFGAEFTHFGYSIYLVSGILAWNSFSAVLLRTANIFKDKSGIIAKVNISLAGLPIYIILSETIIFIISMAFFVLFLLLIGFPITIHWLILPLIYLLQVLLAYSIGFTLATLSVFIKDIREFISVFLQLWFWFTPVVYVLLILPEKLQVWFHFNPMYQIITAYRDIIIYHKLPAFFWLVILFVITIVLLFVALKLFSKLEKDLRDFI